MSRSTTVTRMLAVVIVLGAVSVAGAGFFLKGARKAKSDPGDVIRRYSIQPCVMITDGSPAGVAATEYWLIRDGGGIALFEREGTGDGAIIENHWTEDDGDHFFVWVKGSHGWEYVFPRDRNEDGVRLVYPKGTYKREKDDADVTRPISDPTAKCVLTSASG